MKTNVKVFTNVSSMAIFAMCVCCFSITASAEKMLNLKMGPAWPKEMRIGDTEGGITAWEPSIEVGMLFNRMVGIGFDMEFQFKRRLDDTTYVKDAITYQVVDKAERFFLFPPSFFLQIDPVPDLIVHPVIRGQVGLSLLYYGNKWFENNEAEYSEDTGLYYGIFAKAGIDALYDLGDKVSVFAGFEFQFGNARNRVDGQSNRYYHKDLYGPGIRLGFRFLI
jgi:hypothetical protein